MTVPKKVSILGATGSVGQTTRHLVAEYREQFEVVALAGNQNAALMIETALDLRPTFVAMADAKAARQVMDGLAGTGIEVGYGSAAVLEAAQRPADWIMAAIVGAAGLAPTLTAVRQGVTVALANKESLVCAGVLFTEECKRSGGCLLPVDSEHNAIFQVFDFQSPESVERIILTASGGPFRSSTLGEMAKATVVDALKHPNWDMGSKITIDSATMFNKGLELIEASFLFPVKHSAIDIVVHPQSIIHSLVDCKDGSTLAQLGVPDMRTPVAVALFWPKRATSTPDRLNLASVGTLTFEKPDEERFPAIRLSREALAQGGTAPVILNAANEVAVSAFLASEIGFLDIAGVVEDCLSVEPIAALEDLDTVWSADNSARRAAEKLVARRQYSIRRKSTAAL